MSDCVPFPPSFPPTLGNIWTQHAAHSRSFINSRNVAGHLFLFLPACIWMWACFFLCVCWFKMAAWSFHWCLFTVVRSTGFGTKLPGVWLQVPALSCVPRPWAAAFLHLLCLQQKAHHSTYLLSGCGDWIRIWVSSAWHSPEARKCSVHISCIFITTWFHKFFF